MREAIQRGCGGGDALHSRALRLGFDVPVRPKLATSIERPCIAPKKDSRTSGWASQYSKSSVPSVAPVWREPVRTAPRSLPQGSPTPPRAPRLARGAFQGVGSCEKNVHAPGP